MSRDMGPGTDGQSEDDGDDDGGRTSRKRNAATLRQSANGFRDGSLRNAAGRTRDFALSDGRLPGFTSSDKLAP